MTSSLTSAVFPSCAPLMLDGADAPSPKESIYQRVVRTLLLGQLAFMFGGGVPYLEIISILVLYAYYTVMTVCSIVCYATDARARRNAHAMLPYAVWYFIFSFWIVLVGIVTRLPDEGSFDVVRDVIRACVVWPAVAAVIPDRGYVRKFASWIALAVAFNAIISFLTPTHPSLFAFILRTEDVGYADRYGQIARPGGMWGNANEAAHAFLFAAMLSVWAPRIPRWVARGSALLGIYFSASRQGVYLITLFAVAYGCYLAKGHDRAIAIPRMLYLFVFFAVLCGGLAIGYRALRQEEAIGSRNFTRIFEADVGDESRSAIAAMSAEQALNGPWYGRGAYSFRRYLIQFGPTEQERGTHDIYLTIWGEAGFPMLIGYVAMLAWGFYYAFKTCVIGADRLALALMWLSYILIGLTYHGQMGAFNALIIVVLLFVLPAVLKIPAYGHADQNCERLQQAER